MKRHTFWWLLAMGLMVPITALASGRTSLGLTVNIGSAPPPPVVVVREEPRCVVVPGSTVYVVERDIVPYDMFRYGVFWYVYNDDHWYRARGYRGPFAVIEVKYVPRAIITVPARHWKHHPHGAPPGLAKKHRHRGHDEVVVVKTNGKKHRGDRD